jgi:hypothetical protein
LSHKEHAYKNKIIVLKSKVTQEDAQNLVENKKTRVFNTLLTRPKKSQVHISSLNMYYEPILLVSGSYKADYYRKAKHTIKVDHNVTEIIIGNDNNGGIFTTRTKSKLQKAFAKKSKNKIDIELEEHVYIDDKDKIYFDHHGHETKLNYKIDSNTTENYSKRILEKNADNVKKLKITYDNAQDKLYNKLKSPIESDVRDITEEFATHEITEIYIPIYEARVIGPQRKTRIIRIDAVKNKVV